MTTLTITPDIERKKLKLAGVVASGEKVSVTIDGFAATDTSHLRLRVMAGDRAVGVFPLEDEDAWTISGSDLACTLNLATEQAERFCRFGANVCIILEDMGTPQLYGVSDFTLRPWIKIVGEDVPVNLENYKIRISRVEKNLLEHIESRSNPHKVTAKQVIGADASTEGGVLNIDAKGIRCTGDGTDLELYGEDDGSAHLRSGKVDLKFPNGGTTVATTEFAQGLADAHAGRIDNPHAVTKAQVGLGNADDTADVDKPVSTAQAAAIKAVSDAVDAEAARAKAAEAAKADRTTVTSLTTRVSNVESKKADKTTVSSLSSSVDSLKSSKRGAYDLAVYRRAVSVQLKITVADNSDGTILGTSETGVYCTFVKSGSGDLETYRGQFGENSYLSLMLAVEGGEIVGGAYGEVEFEGESAMITNLTYEGSNRVTGSTTLTTGAEFFLYEVKGTIENDTSTSDHGTLLTSADGAALKSSAVSDAVSQARTAAKADRPFDVADVAAGATLANATVSRFSPADASEVAFTLADPPSGKMAEYELWVDCTAAAPASLTFRLANAQIDPRVEGEVEAMAVGKAYAYRVRAFGNPDAAHVTVIISQSEAAPAGYTPDQLYAPDSAFEIDTTKGDGLTFSVQVGATASSGDNGYATVVWGDGTSTRRSATSSTLTEFTHTYAKAGNYVVRIANSDRFYLAGSPMVVRALRWGDTVTEAPGTYSACLNLAGTVPPWGKAMLLRFSGGDVKVVPDEPAASTRYGAYTYCSGLTGEIPPWPDTSSLTGGNVVVSLVYAGCSGLTGTIPPWPYRCIGISMTYAGCSGLTGPIPAWPLFPLSLSSGYVDYCIALNSAYGTFWHCSGLTGEIPAWPEAHGNMIAKVSYPSSSTYADYDYLGMFAGCSGLTGKIPKWTGSTAESSWQFTWVAGLYAGCTGLEGIWDEDAADSEVMPSTATQHTGCVEGASEAVRKHFTAEWGGTKGASST